MERLPAEAAWVYGGAALAGFIALALMNLGLLGYERKTKKILLA